jgi:hypothetical protein
MYEVKPAPDGATETVILDAGANPPNGVVVQYYLNQAPEQGVRITFLDEQGNEIRTFPSGDDADAAAPPAKAGMNCFVWNLRYPGPLKVAADDLHPWEREDGPLVVPGRYQVRLAVNGTSETQPFEVRLDPRVTAKAEDLAAQRDFLLKVRDRLTATNDLINQVDTLREQAAAWSKRSDDPALTAKLEALTVQLDDMRSELIDVHWDGPQLWPTGLHEKFSALLESADGADFAPQRQSHEVFAELSGRLDDLRRRFDNLTDNQLAALNEAIQSAKLPPIGVA